MHSVIFNSRRSSITTDIIEARQFAVAGTVSFHPPGGYGSHPVAALRTDRRIQIALATALLLGILLAGSLLLLL